MERIVENCIDSYRSISNIHVNCLIECWVLWSCKEHHLIAAPSTSKYLNPPVLPFIQDADRIGKCDSTICRSESVNVLHNW